MSLRRVLGSALLLLGLGLAGTAAPVEAPLSVGEAIYRNGVLGSGALLVGVRKDSGQDVQGDLAACVGCHRNSGLGSKEGTFPMPPISGRYLYHASIAGPERTRLPFVVGQRLDHEAYTDATLARAIREGIDSDGKQLGYLMPRFALGDDDMAALIAYLKTLSAGRARGVNSTVLHFATIVTPDADPVKRSGMLDVLQQFFAEKNAKPLGSAAHMKALGRNVQGAGAPVAGLHWQLHVWQLHGPPSGWSAELQHYLASEPVMAVISGLGGSEWAPVHDFCEGAHLPCLFPNLEVPVEDDHDFYSLYFSRGVLLEARLIARRIAGTAEQPPAGPVQQVYRAGDSGEAAARTLAAALQDTGLAAHGVAIPANATASDVREALRRAEGRGPLVLWLRPGDLEALADVPAPARPVFVSGLMGGLENAPLPADWRAHALLAYPFDLPEHRIVRVDYPLGWFRIRNIQVVAQQVQVDTFLACGMVVEALSRMDDNAVPEYLIEQLEDIIGHRVLTGYYPRLSLAPGQHYASKGGYLVQFAGATGGKLSAASDWVVP